MAKRQKHTFTKNQAFVNVLKWLAEGANFILVIFSTADGFVCSISTESHIIMESFYLFALSTQARSNMLAVEIWALNSVMSN